MAKNEKKDEAPKAFKFPKETIAKTKRYRDRVDLVNALLEDGKEYTFEETDEIIKIFMEREVK